MKLIEKFNAKLAELKETQKRNIAELSQKLAILKVEISSATFEKKTH